MENKLLLLGVLTLAVILGLAACGPGPTETPAPTQTLVPTLPPPTPTSVGGEPAGGMPASNTRTAPLIHQAIEDLSQRLGLDPQQIHLQGVEDVQWRDSSLGCPEPGMNYLMVITPGYLIRLEAEGQVYEYHASENRVVYCDNPQAPFESGSD